MALGAIAKSVGGALVKKKAKQVATDKLMGRGKKKDSGIVKSKTNKEIIGNMMGRKIGSEKTTDIPASKQTINVTPLGSDSPVKTSSGGGDIKIVQDISIAVSAIAESMKSGLVLKEKAQRKKRLAEERDKRAAQEAETEKPDKPKKESGMPKFKIPGVGLLDGIFGFITKFIFGVVIMKLIDLLPKLKGLLEVLKGAGEVFNFLISGVGFILDALIGAVDFGYKLVDGAEKIVGKIFGEEGAEKFRTFIKNFTTLINSFLIFKILKAKVFDAIVRNIKNAFKFAKNIIKTAGKIAAKLFPNLAKGAGKLFQAGKGLVSKGIAKVGGFAAKIFGKAAGVISPAFKGAKPFLSKFFSKVPIVGPLVITIVSLLSGEPASQAIFKGLGGAVGEALGSLIPIPILGTLIGGAIGVFIGDLLYEGLMGEGWGEVGKKLKDTFMTMFKGGKAVFDFFKKGFGNFINSFMEEHSFELPDWVSGTIKSVTGLEITKLPNLLQLYNPFVVAPLLVKSFFGGGGESSGGNFKPVADNKIEGRISRSEQNKAGKDAEAVAAETTYESGEGNEVIVPVPVVQVKEVRTNRRGSGARKRKKDPVDQSAISMYAGK
jgi:hypothetical protein